MSEKCYTSDMQKRERLVNAATRSQVMEVFEVFNAIHSLPNDVLIYLLQHMHSVSLKKGDLLH